MELKGLHEERIKILEQLSSLQVSFLKNIDFSVGAILANISF
jgi:hypothetical protein